MKLKFWLLMLFLATSATLKAQQKEVIFYPPIPYVAHFIANDSVPVQSVNHGNFRIYFQENSYAAKNLPHLKQELNIAFNRILAVLGATEYNRGINLLAVDSEDAMQELMGMHIKGGALQGHDFVFFVFNEKLRPQFKHEIFHIISFALWGKSPHRMLEEGAAQFTDNDCFYENPIYGINAYFLQHKKLMKLEDLVHNFDAKAKESDVIAYLQSAAVIKYLQEKYGNEKLKKLCQQGFADLEKIYGFNLKKLEKDWQAYIRTIPPAPVDFNKLMKEGCG
ncbi:hypothetical protein I5M27_03690 [Adhaeribacter sp. BT258]|uniref:Peptidase MA-like domain-containing protein n=1 Tax=Adhaeribacter terrigena TaxID=2793070 RepID=A0ABS1BY40_9BACT|nr:hypothetical protein [Adhaeribacter terrigena]MBK0402071.1 hypothetical protein [Adhaeribacter terrigena]